VGAKQLEDLVVWQLAVLLRDRVIAISDSVSFDCDRRLRDQVRTAAGSIAANVAEGYGRFRPREFARFLRYANGSVFEVRSHLSDAHARRFLDEKTLAEVMLLCRRTSIAITRLNRYLERCEREGPRSS
jgi:four helix bundle protein